ncbi:class E sortase [Aquipuribacter hungaricus]|uniref:Class E sortase n=1 Tax=Aquipuribacter hungaricus TaxID=545624 RepID=A0ABV7WKQ0_9MICO
MSAVRVAVGTLGELLVTAGVLVLLFLAWQLWWTDVVAERAQERTTTALLESWDAGAPAAPEPAGPAPAPGPPAALQDLPAEALAVLRVPAFGDGWVRPVIEGTGTEVLQQGVGHYTDAAMPGEVGNFAVAGHRTTYGAPFGPIADLVEGDPVVVETPTAFHVYRVTGSQVVRPRDVEVIAPVPDRPGETPTEAWLTMTSCHPMFSARERYVVHALLESSTPRRDGPPAVLAAAGTGTAAGTQTGAG